MDTAVPRSHELLSIYACLQSNMQELSDQLTERIRLHEESDTKPSFKNATPSELFQFFELMNDLVGTFVIRIDLVVFASKLRVSAAEQ